MKTFGERLKELRIANGFGQKEVAAWIGVSDSSIRKYESGERTPDPNAIKTLARQFNVTTDYLLGNDAQAASSLPPLTPKDEREISKDLENMIESLSGAAAMGDSEDDEDMEMLRASLKQAMMLSKRIAKKKFTPKKYRKDETATDTATLIGKKILTASPDAQIAVSAIIQQDKEEKK